MGVHRGRYAEGFAPRDFAPRYPSLWTRRLVSFAPCLGPSGSTLRDWSGNNNHAALTGFTLANAWNPSSGAYALTGAGGTEAGVFSSRQLQTQSFSISLWVFRNGNFTSFSMPLGVTDNTGSNGWRIFPMTVTGLLFSVSTYNLVANQVQFGTLPNQTWVHLAATYDGSALSAYFNGVLANTKSLSTAITYTNAAGGIFNASGWNEFVGAIDDVAIYDRKLTEAEITLLARRRGIAYEYERTPRLMTYMRQSGGLLLRRRKAVCGI